MTEILYLHIFSTKILYLHIFAEKNCICSFLQQKFCICTFLREKKIVFAHFHFILEQRWRASVELCAKVFTMILFTIYNDAAGWYLCWAALPATNQPGGLKLSSIEKFKDAEQCILGQSRPVNHLQLLHTFWQNQQLDRSHSDFPYLPLFPHLYFNLSSKIIIFVKTPGSDKKRASVKHYPQTTTLSTASYNFWSQENWMFDANFSWVGQTFQSVSLCVRGGKLPNVQRGGESQQTSTFSSSSGTLMSHLCWTAGPA